MRLASRDQTIKRWTFRGMQVIDTIDTTGSPITHMAISSDDVFIVVSCQNTTIQVKSLVTASDIHNLEGHSSEVTSLSISNDAMCCYVGCSNGYIYIYNLRSRVLLQSLKQHDSAIIDLYMSVDDCFLFSASEVKIILCVFLFKYLKQNIHFRIQSMFSMSNNNTMVL